MMYIVHKKAEKKNRAGRFCMSHWATVAVCTACLCMAGIERERENQASTLAGSQPVWRCYTPPTSISYLFPSVYGLYDSFVQITLPIRPSAIGNQTIGRQLHTDNTHHTTHTQSTAHGLHVSVDISKELWLVDRFIWLYFHCTFFLASLELLIAHWAQRGIYTPSPCTKCELYIIHEHALGSQRRVEQSKAESWEKKESFRPCLCMLWLKVK